MLIKCPECRGIVSDTANFCPHCGYVLTPERRRERSGEEISAEPGGEKTKPRKKSGCFAFLLNALIGIVVFCLLCLLAGYLALNFDMMGIKTKLRNVCSRDSGSGSRVDSSSSRVVVKYYIVKTLDFIDGSESAGPAENGASGTASDPQPKDSGTAESPVSTVRHRSERTPIELPPDPPME